MADAFTNYQTSRFATPSITDIDAELASSAQRMQRAGLAIAGSIAPPTAPEELASPSVRTAKVAYDPTQGKLFIGGYVVDKNNDTDVATMAKFAGQEAPLPEGNWQDVDPNSFTQYVQSIRDPNTLTLMAKNFGMGVDEMQQMAGYGLQWLGAESAGQYLADQGADLQRNQVYNRNFTDIGSSPEQGVLDWMAATIGRLGPNIVESTISAGIGAAIGGATTGPAAAAGAPIGAVAGFFGKSAVKKMLLDASKKRLMGEALSEAEKKLLISAAATSSAAKAAIEKQAAGKLLTAAEEALVTGARAAGDLTNVTRAAGLSRLAPGALGQYVDEALTGGAIATRNLVGRRAAQVGGAAATSYASNLFQQTGAAYGETMADGGPGDRATALAVGIPGALVDTIPEFLLAGRLFSELGGDVVSAAKKRKSAMDILKGAASGRTGRIAGYAGAGAAIEGATEGFQEVLQIAANPILDLGSAEASNRIVNAFAAGALMGGTLGGAGGAFAGNLADNKQEANLLLPVSQSDPNYAQYRADLKAKLGEAEYKNIFGPPQPYTRIMEESAAQGVDQTPAEAEADWQRLFGYAPATRMQSFPPPAEPFAAPTAAVPQGEMFPGVPLGAAPMALPVAEPPAATPDMLAQGDFFAPPRPPATLALPPASTVYVPPTGPEQIGSPPTPESDWQRLFGYVPNTDNLAPTPRTPQGELLLRGGRGRAPARVPPSPMPEPSADLGGVQGILQPRREFPDTYGVSSTAADTQLARGLAPLRRQMEFEQARQQAAATRATPAERAYTEATISQSIELDIDAVVSPDKLGKKLTPNERDRRKIIAGFNALTLEQQERILVTFNNDETQLFGYVRREKPPVVRKQFATLARVPETAFEVAIPKPLKEKANAPKPGTGTGSAAPAGKQGSEDRGPSAGDKLRQNAKATGQETASETQGTPSGGKPLQAEAAVPSAVKPRRKPLKKDEGPPSPKAPEVAATSAKTADEVATETDRNVWDDTFDDGGVGYDSMSTNGKAEWRKLVLSENILQDEADALRAKYDKVFKAEEKARKAAETAADKARKAAEDEARRSASGDYDSMSEALQNELANDGKDKGTLIANKSNKAPKKPTPSDAGYSKATQDIYEVYEAISNIITARRVRARVVDLDAKDTAKLDFINSTKFLYGWITDNEVHPQAQNIARAYLEKYVSTTEDLKGVEQAIKNARQTGMFKLSDFDLVENPIDENGRPAKGVNPIRVKAIVDKFRSGLAKAPQFYVYKNQADLQRRNPALYQQAVGSRPQGDFDTARASGFAFDGKVLVFTDRIPTEKYMRLLLAHESIGHFGMRALLPASKFDALMDYVYENNMAVRSAVDSKLGVRSTGVAPMSRRGFLKGTSSVIGAAVVPKMPRIPAKLDVDTFITAYTELQNKLGNINNPDSIGKMGDLFLEILSPIKGKNASDAKQAVNKMDSILDNARRYVDDNMNRTLDNLEQRLEFGPDDDYLTYWFEENEAEAAPLLKQFSSLIEEAYQKRNVEIADHVRSTLDMVKNKLGGSAKTEARSSTSEDVDMLGARREAVEEYMAKYAEKLDSSVITRVWNAIKDVLNKLGIKFEDDIVRYLVSQARRTVREGSSMFTPSTFALNVHTITTNNGTGRFSQEPLYTAQHELSNAFHLAAPPPYNLDTARQTLKDYKIDSADKLENFMRNVFRLRNFNALRNHGAKRFEDLKDAMRVAAQALRNVYNEKLAGLLALTGESRHVVSYALIVSRRIADRRFMLDKELRNSGLIVLGDEQPDGTRALDVNKPIFERLLKMGTLSRDELNNGAEVTFEEPTEGGKYKKTTVKIPGVKDKLGRDLTDNEYNIYVKTRRDLAELDVERLKGQLQNFIATEEITTKGIRKVLADKNMTDADVSFVKSVVNHAKKLHLDDIEYDERGMPIATPKDAVRMEQYFAAINNAVVKREFTDDLKAEVRKFYLPKQGRDEDGNIKEPSAEALAEGNKKSEAAVKKIEEFRSRRTEFTGREEQSVVYTLQDRIKEIVLADAAFEKAQMSARRSIGSSHVPLWREGSWQVRVEAQINGKAVKLHPEVQNKLLFSLHTQRSESENAAAVFNGEMKGLEYSGLVYNEENGEYKTQTFKLFAVPSKVVESVASEPSIDIDNFLYTLRVLGQPLAPDKHAKAITMLTAPGSALRKALRFDDTPGYDPLKSVEAIARHVTTRSSLIARTKFQPHMRDLMDLSTDTGKLWFGDAEAVMTAKENLDKATTDAAKAYWQDRLTTDLYKYVTTNPGAKGWDGSRASFPSQPTKASLGMRDYSDSVKEMEWMQDSSNINESTFEGKQFASGMKMITSIAFLGGMFTQFAQNLMSPATNVMPYLASKDSQTGFGGGFGMAVMPTYLKAFKDVVGFRGLNPFSDPIKDAEAFDKIASDIKAARDTKNTAKEAELTQQYGLSYYEALNIAREIREGKLIPAQANALLETARGIFTGPVSKGFLKFSDFYMSPFNVSEQATRRATFLTAFRLEFDRLVQAGFNEDKASEMARMFAVDTVDKTLGEYSNTNRPPVWRDGWQSLLFVYKTYPLTSLLLFKNLSRAGKIGMLTSLYVLAGAAGFPLVDDMEDFIDTLSQRLGLDLGQGPAVRMAIIRQLEEVFPGWSDMILRGPLNHYTGADIGAKFGLEDFIPGTGILLKGANTTEELKNIAGPVVGMSLSMGKFLYDAARAPLSSTVSFTDVARESPFSLMRAGGDVAAYLQNGAIVDRRGYVVSPEVNAMTMAYRLMGFYPAEAAKQYDFIKYANRMNYDYKEVGTAYKLAWVKAKMTGDDRQAARIVREVNDWNEANRGGPGVIRNFLKNAQRALKEARRPAGERFLKSAPVASRASYDRFLEYITE